MAEHVFVLSEILYLLTFIAAGEQRLTEQYIFRNHPLYLALF